MTVYPIPKQNFYDCVGGIYPKVQGLLLPFLDLLSNTCKGK